MRSFQSQFYELSSFSLIAVLIFLPILSIPSSADNIHLEPTRTSSLDGNYPLADSAYATFVGSGEESPQGKLGEFVGNADVNGDGIQDIVMAAPRLYSPEGEQHSGVCYIWYGNATLPSGIVDLEKDPPDITIRATSPGTNLLSSISAGDLNDDGYVDMALGMPKQGDSGKVYVLWGKETGWDSEITLYKAGNAEPNGNPLGFLRREDFGIISGFVGTNVLGTKLGKNVIIHDIDDDGSDDLLFSFHGWNKVFILWGGYTKMSFGTEYTYIQLDLNNVDLPGDFGNTVEIGDLDGNGRTDLIIGAPFFSNEELMKTQTGALFVYYNASNIRNHLMMNSSTGCRPMIFGQDPFDHLGGGLVVEDINGDGMDDILAGAPDADGLGNLKPGAGQILVYRGGEISKFPSVLLAEEMYDLMIVGERSTTSEHPGDSIGSTFDVGDIDGDSMKELAIGIPGRSFDGIQSVGMVTGYDDNVAFPNRKGVVDLGSAPMKFSVWGSEIEDVTGYTISIFDANDDGADDILVGSPSADGIENLRPGCGEVSLLTGTALSIEGVTISGTAVVNGRVLPGYGPFSIYVPFSHTEGAENVVRIDIVLEKGTFDAHLIWEGGVFSYQGPSIVSIDPANCRIVRQGTQGSISFSTSLGWFSDIGRPWDIDISIEDGDGRSVERTFHDFMRINNRIILGDVSDTFIDGEETFTGEWQRPGSSLEVSGIELFYADSGRVPVPEDDFGLVLWRNGEKVDSVVYKDESTVLEDSVSGLARSQYQITPTFDITPGSRGPGEAPMISGSISFNIITDSDVPHAPENLRLIPDTGRDSIFDDDGAWTAEWNSSLGPEGDHNSSGVREYRLKTLDTDPEPIMTQGGLWGTYYDQTDLSIYSFQRADRELRFNWGYWGPDEQKLTPAAFSARWHGWLMVEDTRSYRFSLTGNGEARLFLGGKMVIDHGDISKEPRTSLIPLEGGVAVPIVVYYTNDDIGGGDIGSSISLLYLDDRGAMSPIPPFMLFYPGNSTEVSSGKEDYTYVEVVAVDWVDHVSDHVSARGYADSDPPIIDLTGIRPWYNTTTPLLEVVISDPPTIYNTGSGIDLGSIRYKLTDEYGWGEWVEVNKGSEILSTGVEGPTEVKTSLRLSLEGNSKPSIQWAASDLCGNTVETPPLDLGVDTKVPVLTVISDPSSSSPADKVRKIQCVARDIGGSGVDGSSILWRTGKGENWSVWRSAGTSGVEEEIEFEVPLTVLLGGNLFQLRATDAVGNPALSQVYSFIGTAPDINRPPVAVIDLPQNGTKIKEGVFITLDASGSSDDGKGIFNPLQFTWYSDRDGYLGSGKVLSGVSLNRSGVHKITVYVDDGAPGHNVSASISLEVLQPVDDEPREEEPDLKPVDVVTILLVIISIIVVAVVLGIIIKSVLPKDAGETRLHVVERTDDDIEYEEMTEDDERFMNGEDEEPDRER